MGDLNLRDAVDFDPETYSGQGGGLLGRLQAIVQPNQFQLNADLGSPSNGAPEFNPGSYDSPQGGLFGRLLALQAEQSQYQPAQETNGPAPSALGDPNFRQISPAPIGIRPQGAIAPSDLPDEQSNPAYAAVGADLAAQPQRSFADRLQASLNHPDPRGLIAMFKGGTNGIVQAVQGSIDATSTPSTEEEAFRQNMGRELGPIGALKALSLRAPLSPASTGGFWRGIANLALSRGASSAAAGINPWGPKPIAPQGEPADGPSGIGSGQPMPQWPFP
jgi:hypothetical protein